MGFSAIFSTLLHQKSLILHIPVHFNTVQLLVQQNWLEKNLALKFGPKMRFSPILSTLLHQKLLILHIEVNFHSVQLLVQQNWLKQIFDHKILPIQAQIGPKMGFSTIISSSAQLILLDSHILIASNDIYLLMVFFFF